MSAARRPVPMWVLVSAAWLGPAILATFQAYAQSLLDREPAGWRRLVWEGGDWLVYALLTPAVFAFAHRFPLGRGTFARRLPVHLAASLLLCAAWAAGGIALSWALFRTAPYGGSVFDWLLTSLPFGVAVYFAVVGAEHAARYFLEARDQETRAARLEAQLTEARLGALRMQLQPHFLLNSLNAVTVIVRDRDTGTATGVLERLGEMLRRVMRSDRPQEVTLADELEFVRQYLSIEEIRYSDRLRVEFIVAPDVRGAAVPEFLLQPLVENAVRHGVARRSAVTTLRVEARRETDDLVLTVADEGPEPEWPTSPGEGVGLGMTRGRLATLYGDRASLQLELIPHGGSRAIVRLPYRDLESGSG